MILRTDILHIKNKFKNYNQMINQIISYALILFAMWSCSAVAKEQNDVTSKEDWKVEVENTLKLYGHRNWIVIADGAYPQQSNPAIKTITIDANQLEAVEFVKQLIDKTNHEEATIFLDKEMEFVAESSAEGIGNYREKLEVILKDKTVARKLHEDIIRELDTSAKLFNVLIIKTDLAIPYTSVFFQLECGYWDAKREEDLRSAMNI